MRECITALGDYAALLAIDNHSTVISNKMRDLVENMAAYWGLNYGVGAKPVEEFLSEFEDKVHGAVRSRIIDVDTYSACADALTGLAQHGTDLINAHGNDTWAMKEALYVGRLMKEIADYYDINVEITYANETNRQLKDSIKDLLDQIDLPGNAIKGEINANYVIEQAILYDNDQGYAFAHNPDAASPYVTWVMNLTDKDELNFEIGSYFQNKEEALVDYIARVESYATRYKVTEKPIPSQVQQQQQDEWRTYKAELHDPENTEFPHLEVFGADNDVDAVEKANTLCNEENGWVLLEVHELDENYESIREIDLRNHDPNLRRFMNVDLIDFLGQIADKTIIHYPQDFKIDIDALWRTAIKENPEENRLMWHCCSYGTHLLDETEVFVKSSGAHGYWVDYRASDEDMFGYVIEVTGYEGDTIFGNVFEVGDYEQHALYVHKNALVLDSVSLTYAPDWGINAGKTVTVPRYEYNDDRHRLMSESGRVTAIKYNPSESVKSMADLLKAEKAKYMAMPIGDTKEHLKQLEIKLAKIRGTSEPTLDETHNTPLTQVESYEFKPTDYVVSAGNSNYPYLVGEITAIHKLGTEEHGATNDTDDIIVEFFSDGYSEERMEEIREHFRKLYGEPEHFVEDLSYWLGEVVMAPEHLIIIKESDIDRLLEGREYCKTFCDSVIPVEANHDKQRVYHADFTDPEIDHRMEIIFAKDDAEAIQKAMAICNEAEGIVLDDLNEIDEDGNSRTVNIEVQNPDEYKKVEAILKRIEAVKSGQVAPSVDNMLKIVSDAYNSRINEDYIKPYVDSSFSYKAIDERLAKVANNKSAEQEKPKAPPKEQVKEKTKKPNRGKDR